MHVIAPEGVSTCRSKIAKGEWVEKVKIMSQPAKVAQRGKFSMKVIEDFASRPHDAVRSAFVVERKERQDWNEKKKCRRRYLGTAEEDYQEEAPKKGREKGEEGEGEIIGEVIRSSQRMALEGHNSIQR